MRRDIWADPHVRDERPQPTVGGFVLTIMVLWAVAAVVVIGLASCGVNLAAL